MTQKQDTLKLHPSEKFIIINADAMPIKVIDALTVNEQFGVLSVSHKDLPKLIKQLIRARVAHVLGFKNVVY